MSGVEHGAPHTPGSHVDTPPGLTRSSPTFFGSGRPSRAEPYRAERGVLRRQRDHPPEGGDSGTDGEGWDAGSGGHRYEGDFSDFSDPDPEDPEE